MIILLEDFSAKVDTEIIFKWSILSPGYFELKKHKPWFDEGCSQLLD
jgi:hypothetical protein